LTKYGSLLTATRERAVKSEIPLCPPRRNVGRGIRKGGFKMVRSKKGEMIGRRK